MLVLSFLVSFPLYGYMIFTKPAIEIPGPWLTSGFQVLGHGSNLFLPPTFQNPSPERR